METAMAKGARPLALVTGASRGIGADLARELAQHGHDLVLAARSLPAMQALGRELEGSGAAVIVIEADLSRPGAAAALAAEIAARGLSIDVLINNAGLGAIGPFDSSDPERVAGMLMVNVVALTELTRLLLPAMIARRRGRIMLVGSIAGFQPCPQMAVYAATKAFVLSFGEALACELHRTGVTVTTLCPGATATDFFTVARGHPPAGRRAMMSPEIVARDGYRALTAGRPVSVTGARNRLLALLGRFMPHALVLPAADRLMRDA